MKPSPLLLAGVCVPLLAGHMALAAGFIPNLQPYDNGSGTARTFTAVGKVDTSNPFFQSLGVNGRACVTCHDPSTGWSITPALVQQRFDATDGHDPLFRSVDGSNSPTADMATREARQTACSLLLNRGLIRVGIGIPQNAEFELIECDDPYGYASSTELSLFRRPLPTANLRFLSAVMWDGRETKLDPAVSDETLAVDLRASLLTQANDATTGHAEARSDLTAEQRQQIVDFQMALTTAQAEDQGLRGLDAAGGQGGPMRLLLQPFFLGINDPLGHNPQGTPFDPRAFTLFDGWKGSSNPVRQSVVRGQELFNTKPIRITGVAGLNDELGAAEVMGTCTTCHDTPNVGNHSSIAPLDIGLTDAVRRTPDMPLYTLRNKSTGATRQTTDPGRALITGKWKDVGRFKGPILRSLASRAPYFHNGLAGSLEEAVQFYESRFAMALTAQEKADLVAFLKSL
jgi:cytochrome c peroxidase